MRKSLILAAALAIAAPAMASDAGLVKVSKGDVRIERAGGSVAATVGTAVQPSDVIVTGADGLAGLTFSDNSLVSLGPNSRFSIDKYRFDSTTNEGQFESSLTKGRLAAISGKMVKQSPEAMKVKTPSAIMGVRGTEFIVQVD